MPARTDSAPRPDRPAGRRPFWLRLLLWVVAAFILINLFSVAVIFFPSLEFDLGAPVRLALVCAAIALPLWKWGGMDVLRTWSNPVTARFARHDDPATGGVLFDVHPARAARMPAMPLFIFGTLILLAAFIVGGRSTGAFVGLYICAIVFIGVGCSFVLPGARDRRPAKISVTTRGVQRDGVSVPLGSVSEVRVSHGGLSVDPDPLVAGPGGVPISSVLGRAMGRRQASRGYAVDIRADGESRYHLLAGGLTEDCAQALAADLGKAIATEQAKPA